MKTIKVNLQDINTNDNTYLFKPESDLQIPQQLHHSFKINGILHPPIILQGPGDYYRIICGRKRLRFLLDENESRCLCHVLPETEDHLTPWQIALEERTLSGPVTAIEKALFFSKILTICSQQEAADTFLPILQEAPKLYSIHKFLPLASFENPIQIALYHGVLDEKAALKMIDLSFRDRMVLFDTIQKLRLSLGNQRKIISACIEIAKRNNSSIMTVLGQDEIREILDSKANIPQKTANLMKLIETLQFPNLHKAQTNHNHFLHQLQLPKGASLTPCQSFETDQVTLHLPFRNRENFLLFWKSCNLKH